MAHQIMRFSSTKRLLTSMLVVATVAAPAVWAPTAEAAAGDKPRVLVIPLQRGPNVSSLIQPKINEYFQTILTMNRKLKVTSIRQLKNAPAKVVSKAVSKDPGIAKADKALFKGNELMEKKKYMPAQKSFAKAKSLYEKKFAELVDFDKYVEAALGQATAYFKAEYDDNGEDALAEVIILRPNTVIDKRRVPKTMIAAMKRLQMLYSRPEKGKVTVSASATGAEVFLDGVLQGTAPVTINGLYRGKHVIRVVADGHKPYAKRVSAKLTDQTVIARLKADAKSIAPTALVQKPTSLISVAKAGAFTKEFRDYAKTLTQRHNLAGILMTYIRKNDGFYDLAAFLYDPEQGHVAQLEWVKIDTQLSTMQASLLQLEERILQALAVFPRTRILDTKSRVYDVIEQRVAVRPTPGPTPAVSPRPGRPRVGLGPKPGRTVTPPKPLGRPAPNPVGPTVYQPKPKAPSLVTPAPKPRPAPVLPGTRPVPPGPVPPGPMPPGPVTAPPTPSPYPVAAPPVPYPAPIAPSPYPPTGPAPYGVKPTPSPVKPTLTPTPVPRPIAGTPAPRTSPLVDTGKPGLGGYNAIGNPNKPWEDPTLNESSDGDAVYEKWWFWTIIGAVVVGGATAAGVVLGTGGDTTPGFRADVKW